MAESLFGYDDDNFEANTQLLESVIESRKKYNEALKKLEKLNNTSECIDQLKIVEADEDINFIQKTIETIRVKPSSIRSLPPGMEIYRKEDEGCLFNSDSIKFSKFSATAQTLKFFGNSDPTEFSLLLRYFTHPPAVSDPALLQYLFFIMSVHENGRLVEICLRILKYSDNSFKPTFNDILAVFVNWGFRVNFLYPESTVAQFEIPKPISDCSPGRYIIFFTCNLEKVLNYLQAWTSNVQELKIFIRLLVLSALDKSFHVYSGKILECLYTLVHRHSWPDEEVIPTIQMLHFKDSHFHNQAHAAWLMSSRSDFGARVSSGLAFAVLQQLLDEKSIHYAHKVDLEQMKNLNLSITAEKSLYEIYIIVWLLKFCMIGMEHDDGFTTYLKSVYLWISNLQNSLKRTSVVHDQQTLNEFLSRIQTMWSSDLTRLSASELPRGRIVL